MADFRTADVDEYLKNMIKTLPYEVDTEIMNQMGFTKLEYLEEVRLFYGQGFYDSLMFGLITDFYKLVSYYKLAEHHIYGSSRLGTREVKKRLLKLDEEGEIEERFGETEEDLYFYRGYKRYEMSNHLGNVLVVISDKRTPVCDGGVSHFEAEVLAAQDYAPFGMLLPERTWTSDSASYRYGFNTQERDDEIYGEGNSTTAEYWQYDSRLGRRWNVDQITYPWQSSYAVNNNCPIYFSDPIGLEAKTADGKNTVTPRGTINSPNGGYVGFEIINSPKPGDKYTINSGMYTYYDKSTKTTRNAYRYSETKVYHGGNQYAPPGWYSEEAYEYYNIDWDGGQKLPEISVLESIVNKRKINLYGFNFDVNRYGYITGPTPIGGPIMVTPYAIPMNMARMGFSVNPSKFNYFFGRVTTGNAHNVARSAQNLKDLTIMGIANESQLTRVFAQAFNSGKVISTNTTQFGTTVIKRINVGSNGSIDVGFFYPGGNMSAIPSVITIIPKTW